jgi:4-hydroxy-tetrahydrodipicolinate reductase
MNILLLGYGRMGRVIESCALLSGDAIVGRVYEEALPPVGAWPAADVAIDFSSTTLLPEIARYTKHRGTPLVSGTTGYRAEDLARFATLGSYAPVVYSANFSVGIAVLKQLLRQIAQSPLMDWDIEIVEKHHNQKADAPSGTAKLMLQALDPDSEFSPCYGRFGDGDKRPQNEIGMHALRGGTVAGEHSAIFFGVDESLEITHQAQTRRIFAEGALCAARALIGRPKGIYTLEELLFPAREERI